MFMKLTDTSKGAAFSVLVLLLAVGAALLINMLGLASNMLTWAPLWASTPAVAALVMLLVITRDGFSREGWKVLGLHRLGLSVWWIAIGVIFLTSLVASAIVWATPLASLIMPEGGLGTPLLQFLTGVVLMTLTFSLGEELGWRGYLLPQLLSVGRTRALVLIGLIWAAWHMPLIFLTPLYHSAGNRLIVLPLFVGTPVAARFVFGYLRILTGSVWPASLGHSVHNVAWSTLGALTATSSPVVVNEYLAGDNGVLILAATAVVAGWLGRKVSRNVGSGQGESQASLVGGEAPAAPAV